MTDVIKQMDDRLGRLRDLLSQPIEAAVTDYPEWVDPHDPDDLQHVQDCSLCSYNAMRSELDPPDLPAFDNGRVYDDHELGYGSDWLPFLTIEQLREELGGDGFSVIWPNVVRR